MAEKKKKVIDMLDFDLRSTKTPVEEPPKKKKKKPKPEVKEQPKAPWDDDEEDLVVQRPKKAGTEIVALPPMVEVQPEGGDRISRLGLSEQTTSILGASAEEIAQLLESGDSDAVADRMNTRMLQACIDLLAQAEKGVRDSNGTRGVMGFNNLVASIRELMIDRQATRDRGAMGETLCESVLRPMLLDIAMMLMTEYSGIMMDARNYMKNEDFRDFKKSVEESRKRAGESMQNQYVDARNKIVEFMQR